MIQRGDNGYPKAHQLFDPRFDDLHPLAVVECTSAADVSAAVQFAKQQKLKCRPKAGGHSYVGASSLKGGMVIDVSRITKASYDASTKIATIGAGKQLYNAHSALANHGRTIPTGTCPTVAAAGLTLGGGLGIASRQIRPHLRPARRPHDGHGRWEEEDGQRVAACRPVLGQPGRRWRQLRHRHDDALPHAVDVPDGLLPDDVPVGSGGESRARLVEADPPDAAHRLGQPPSRRELRRLDRHPRGRNLPRGRRGRRGDGDGERRRRLPDDRLDVPEDLPAGRSSSSAEARRRRGRRSRPAATSSRRCRPTSRRRSSSSSSIERTTAKSVSAILDPLTGKVSDIKPKATAFPWRNHVCDIQWYIGLPNGASNNAVQSAYNWIGNAHKQVKPYSSGGYINYLEPGRGLPSYYGPNFQRLKQIKAQVDPHGFFHTAYTIP